MTETQFRIDAPTPAVMAPGETIVVPARLHNLTAEPLLHLRTAPLNLSYHWLRPDGACAVFDGRRTGLLRSLEPFSSMVLSLSLQAPAEPGRYELALDLVEEGVRWFGLPGQGATAKPVLVSSNPPLAPPAPSRTLVVSAADENFFPIARGLYLSLLACGRPDDSVSLGFIDIDDSSRVRAWMCAQGIVTGLRRTGDLASEFVPKPQPVYTGAQSIRPFLPLLFPEFQRFVWIDSDAWVQQPRSLEILIETCAAHPDKLAICPVIDVAYEKFYHDYGQYLRDIFEVNRLCFDEATAREMQGRAVLSSGVFSMSAGCPLWESWQTQLSLAYEKDYSEHLGALHVAEQMALNVAAYRSGQFIALEASHNFHCHAWAKVERDESSGQVTVKDQPFRPLGIVHLADFPRHGADYLARGLLYQRGDYLAAAERQALAVYRRH